MPALASTLASTYASSDGKFSSLAAWQKPTPPPPVCQSNGPEEQSCGMSPSVTTGVCGATVPSLSYRDALETTVHTN
jgi:hypothetical protein